MGTGHGDQGGALPDADHVREYFRVRTEIPLRTALLDRDDYEQVASQVLSHIAPELPELDPALVAWLDRIERKLDRVLRHFAGSESRASSDWGRTTGLSGSGLSFVPDRPIEPESALVLEFELPETPVRIVRCIGRVADATATTTSGSTRPDASEPGEIGVAFETIRVADRDAVVRFTLEVQRQQIRLDYHSDGRS